MSGFASSSEKDLEQLHSPNTQGSTDESHELEEYSSQRNVSDAEKQLTSNTLSDDSCLESHLQSQIRPQSTRRSSSRRNSRAISLSRLRSNREIPINLSHPMQKQQTGAEVLVDFDGQDDPYRPINWPFRKKVIATVLYGFTTCWITFASAIYSAATRQIADEFHVTMEVATAGISMVVFGFGLGPLIWAPLSEVYGRKMSVFMVRRRFGVALDFPPSTDALMSLALLYRRGLLLCHGCS